MLIIQKKMNKYNFILYQDLVASDNKNKNEVIIKSLADHH